MHLPIIFRIVTWLLWLLAILLAAEALVHFAFDPPVSLISRDPVLGWRFVSNRKIGKQPDGSYFLTTNSHGFRGRDFPPQKESSKYRVMVLGDSYTAGVAFADGKIFTSLLEGERNRTVPPSQPIEVMNVAISAWSTDQQLLYFQKEGAGYHPDVVIVAMAPNDIREAFGKRLLTLESGKLVEHPTPAVGFKDSTEWWLLNHSAIAQWLGRKYGFSDIYPILQRRYDFSFRIGNREATDVDLFRPALPAPLPQAHALWEAEISQLAEDVAKAGGKLVLTVLPTKIEFQFPLSAGDPDLQPGYVSEYAKSFAAKKNILFVDLWGKIKREKNPLSLFIADEYHFNEAGHQFVAGELAKALNDLKLGGQ